LFEEHIGILIDIGEKKVWQQEKIETQERDNTREKKKEKTIILPHVNDENTHTS